MAINIALEIGSTYTTIFVENYNVVLREPSAIAFMDDSDHTVRAVGEEAVEMQGRAGEKINVVYPVVDGYLSDKDAASLMLSEFLRKIFPRIGKLFSSSVHAIVSVPAAIDVEERKAYEDVCVKAGISKVEMVDKVLLSAIGADLDLKQGGVILVSIGGGSTEIALVGQCAVLSGCSVNIGGNMMDRAIMDAVIGKYGVKLDKTVVTELKESIGTLFYNDISQEEVKGLNTDTVTPAACTVYAYDLYESLLPYYERIAEGIMGVVNECPSAFAQSLHDMGVFVVGGGAKIPGLKGILEEKLSLPVTVCKEPEYASVVGGGKLISDKELLTEINAR